MSTLCVSEGSSKKPVQFEVPTTLAGLSGAVSIAPTGFLQVDQGIAKVVHHAPEGEWENPSDSVQSGFWERCLLSIVTGLLWLFDKLGLLKTVMRGPVAGFVERGDLGHPCPELVEETVSRVAGMVHEEMNPDRPRESWPDLSARIHRKVAPGNEATVISSPTFKSEMEELTDAKFSSGNKVKLLNDGPAAFDKRFRLIEKAKSRIQVLTFHLEDDATGKHFSQLLAEAARRGVRVQVLVDAKVSGRQPNTDTLDLIKAAGGEIAYWDDTRSPLLSLHSKIFVADDQAILGGMNYGDAYSHGWQAEGATDQYGKWRDTDILMKGPAAVDCVKGFAERWNESLADGDTPMSLDEILPVTDFGKTDVTLERDKPVDLFPTTKTRDIDVAILNHRTGIDGDTRITEAMLKLIWGAEKTIDIQNAYFLKLPPVHHALVEAMKRGVRVRIQTNSLETTCEPILAGPSLRAAKELLDAGAEVSLRTDRYIHSKSLVVDDEYSLVGSYNLHPRTIRYDCEINALVHSREFARKLTDVFEYDLLPEHATPMTATTEVPEGSLTTRFLERYFYEHI